jgi:hypothetical protein
MIFLFNVFDVLGRLVALRGLVASPRAVVSASFMRWLLVPLFFFASAGRLHMDNDILKVVLQGVFGGTYGYFLTCGMAWGPIQPGIDAGQADTAGAAMSFAQVNGILVGALISGIARDIPRNFLNFRPYDRQCAYNDQAMFMCTDIISIPNQTTTQAP